MPKVDRFYKGADILFHLVEVKKKEFMIDLWSELVAASPRVTGKMQNSWFVSAGKPISKEIPDGSYGIPPIPNIGKYGKRNYTKWFLTNTAPYTAKVNYQTAKQVPTLFIERARDRVLSKYG